jgi:hypothetical protein
MKRRNKNCQAWRILHWQGAQYERDRSEYQALLDRAYFAMYRNRTHFVGPCWRRMTHEAVLQHFIGQSTTNETVLTRAEFYSSIDKAKTRYLSVEHRCAHRSWHVVAFALQPRDYGCHLFS